MNLVLRALFGIIVEKIPYIIKQGELERYKENERLLVFYKNYIENIESKWQKLHPEDFRIAVHTNPNGTQVFTEKWRIHFNEHETDGGAAKTH